MHNITKFQKHPVTRWIADVAEIAACIALGSAILAIALSVISSAAREDVVSCQRSGASYDVCVQEVLR